MSRLWICGILLMLAVVASAGQPQQPSIQIHSLQEPQQRQQQQQPQQAVQDDPVSKQLRHTAQSFLDAWLKGSGDDAQPYILDDAILVSPFTDLAPIRGHQFNTAQRHLLQVVQVYNPQCRVLGVDPLRLSAVAECLHESLLYVPTGRRAQNVRAGALFQFEAVGAPGQEQLKVKEFVVTDAEGKINALAQTPAELHLNRLMATGVQVLLDQDSTQHDDDDDDDDDDDQQRLQPLLELIHDDIVLQFHGLPAPLESYFGGQSQIKGKQQVLDFVRKLARWGAELDDSAGNTHPQVQRVFSDASSVVTMLEVDSMRFAVSYEFDSAGLLVRQDVAFLGQAH